MNSQSDLLNGKRNRFYFEDISERTTNNETNHYLRDFHVWTFKGRVKGRESFPTGLERERQDAVFRLGSKLQSNDGPPTPSSPSVCQSARRSPQSRSKNRRESGRKLQSEVKPQEKAAVSCVGMEQPHATPRQLKNIHLPSRLAGRAAPLNNRTRFLFLGYAILLLLSCRPFARSLPLSPSSLTHYEKWQVVKFHAPLI